ncbi:MAG: hypothetical protein JWN71_2804 [Xanthobacteraceae bacterium]|nr:hypothetical protein [Xanthobacteraceae bacterium]
MTNDPPDPSFRQAAAAYRSAGDLRKPQPASQIVRLIDQPGQPPAPEQESNRTPEPTPASNGPAPAARAAGVSLMITNAQKDSLRQLGVSEDELRDMTPSEAHRRLGLSGR